MEEAGLGNAKLLISTLHIELTNDLLAFHCKRAGVRSAIHAVDLSTVDNLLAMDVEYVMAPKLDGMKRQAEELQRRGIIGS